MEPGIREEFTLRTGIATQRRGLLANKERPYMRASVDSLTSDGGILEIKTNSYHNRRHTRLLYTRRTRMEPYETVAMTVGR